MRTFDQLFGPGHAFCPAAIGEARRWLPAMPEILTGGQLPFIGAMPCFSHIASATDIGLRHLSEAGHHLPEQLETYNDEPGLVGLLRQYVHAGWKIVASHLPYPAEFVNEQFWVAPELVARINNKQFLAEWVPQAHLPDRVVEHLNNIRCYDGPLPMVLKAASYLTTGGGIGVMRCSDRDDLYTAENNFRGCEQIVVEQWLNFKEIWCLNYACLPDGSIAFLGAAQQCVNTDLEFTGNLFFSQEKYSPEMQGLGEMVCQKIASAGYYGVVGLDLGKTDDDALYIYDINCRMNASTTPLLALKEFSWLREYPTQRTVRLQGGSSLAGAIRLSEKALAMQRFLPLSTFDPIVTDLGGSPFVAGLLAGESEAEISAYMVEQLGQN